MSDLITMMAGAAGYAASQTGGYQISRSLRFNSADSAYLSRTPASAGNRKTWTWSGWVKRTGLSSWGYLIDTDSTNGQTYIHIDATSGQLRFYTSNGTKILLSTSVYRDPSSWLHIVGAVDTTQATESDRVKLYVNGIQITSFATEQYPAQNADLAINSAQAHNIGRRASDRYFDGYLADINFVDGQALTPSSFGETDATTGVWKPKAYTGTYGTNGFYLNFSDNTSTTTLGEDQAGSNDWTLNNFSVTAGAGNDSLVDTPTPYGTDTGAGGEVRGNYATLNPLANGGAAPSNGNLQLAGWGTTYGGTRCNGTIAVSSGKWYWETTLTTVGTFTLAGINQDDSASTTTNYPGRTATSYAYECESGNKINNDVTSSYGSALTSNNDVLMIALDLDNNKIFFGKNGTWFASSDPATGANPAYTITAGTYRPSFRPYGSGVDVTVNFGQRSFAHAAPAGFKALCTQNLPDPTIADGGDYFNTVLYTGTGSSQSITGVGFQPDWVWIKERSGAADHGLYDAVRGVQQQLESNTTDAETTESTGLTAFGSDGFTVGALAQLNTNTDTYVAWNWNAGGSNATNTDGTITSTVRANPTAGFSIVSWTANGSNTDGVGHGLGVTPKLVIYKNRDTANDWFVWTTVIDGSNDDLRLNGTNAKADITGYGNLTSTTISNYGWGDTRKIIAYCFAEVEGFSKIGSYTGNGSTDGPFVYCGFRPAWLLVKRSSVAGNYWVLTDTARGTYNVMGPELYPNASDAEAAGTKFDYLSNGFKLRSNAAAVNNSTDTYIFMAFAENPFKYSLAR